MLANIRDVLLPIIVESIWLCVNIGNNVVFAIMGSILKVHATTISYFLLLLEYFGICAIIRVTYGCWPIEETFCFLPLLGVYGYVSI